MLHFSRTIDSKILIALGLVCCFLAGIYALMWGFKNPGSEGWAFIIVVPLAALAVLIAIAPAIAFLIGSNAKILFIVTALLELLILFLPSSTMSLITNDIKTQTVGFLGIIGPIVFLIGSVGIKANPPTQSSDNG